MGAGGRCYCNSEVAFFVALSLQMSRLGWDSLDGAICAVQVNHLVQRLSDVSKD